MLLWRRTSQKCFNKKLFALKNSFLSETLKTFQKKKDKNLLTTTAFLENIHVFLKLILDVSKNGIKVISRF